MCSAPCPGRRKRLSPEKARRVDDRATRFNEVKKSDMAVREHVRTVAVSVKKPEKK
jgi:hypothetical protein